MALAFRKANLTVPKAPLATRVAVPRPVQMRQARFIARAEPQDQSAIEKAVKEAEECGDPKARECAPAWDNVEEASAAAAHKKQNQQDPMEQFCEGNEDADECRVHDN